MVSGRKNPLFFGLALRLKQARGQAGLKRLPLAQKAGLAMATGRDVELGARVPTVTTVLRLASALQVSPAWLAYGVGAADDPQPMQSAATMGERLASLRADHGLSRAALARACDLSARAIAKIEAGGQSGVDIIESLAKALGVSPAWLAYGAEPKVLPQIRRGRPPAQPPADAR
jgi:transcriptional regulator with XRE-family HTH domain